MQTGAATDIDQRKAPVPTGFKDSLKSRSEIGAPANLIGLGNPRMKNLNNFGLMSQDERSKYRIGPDRLLRKFGETSVVPVKRMLGFTQ
jgi:hypothetical protein